MAIIHGVTYDEWRKDKVLQELNKSKQEQSTISEVFDFESSEVRTITDETGIWFALIDVCNILGLSNPTKVSKRLDEDELANFKLGSRSGDTLFVNEPGLYHVLLTSRSEKAKPFRRWVTHDVLPSIRKHGFYSLISDRELLDVLWERIKDQPQLVSKVFVEQKTQNTFKKYIADKELADLWKQRKEIDPSDYEQRLAEICNGNITRYTKEYEKYLRWRDSYRTLQTYTENRKLNEGVIV